MDRRLIYRNILLENQFSDFAQNCRRKGIQICPLKGMGLILSGLYAANERDMEDIDILIRKEDELLIDKLLKESGYYPVVSGERGYHRKGEPAVIDIHTDILYMSKERLRKLWNEMPERKNLKFMSEDEHFIYILAHALVQHACLRASWTEDLRRLLERIPDPAILNKKARNYGVAGLLNIYDKKRFPLKKRGLRGLKHAYVKFIMSVPHFTDKGHFIRPVFAGNFRETSGFIINFIFPSLKFLERRYRFRPVELLFYFRPFLLLIKMVKEPLGMLTGT
jgi:hypothetical protein